MSLRFPIGRLLLAIGVMTALGLTAEAAVVLKGMAGAAPFPFYARPGEPLPVTVIVANHGDEVAGRLIVRFDDGRRVRDARSAEVTLALDATKRFVFVVAPRRGESGLAVVLEVDGEEVGRWAVTLDLIYDEEQLVLVAPGDRRPPDGLVSLTRRSAIVSGEDLDEYVELRERLVQVASAEDLPSIPAAYTSYDALLIEADALRRIDGGVRNAMIDYALLGGNLVVACGADGAAARRFLDEGAPGRIGLATGGRTPLLPTPSDELLMADDDGPVAIRLAAGMGTITVVGPSLAGVPARDLAAGIVAPLRRRPRLRIDPTAAAAEVQRAMKISLVPLPIVAIALGTYAFAVAALVLGLRAVGWSGLGWISAVVLALVATAGAREAADRTRAERAAAGTICAVETTPGGRRGRATAFIGAYAADEGAAEFAAALGSVALPIGTSHLAPGRQAAGRVVHAIEVAAHAAGFAEMRGDVTLPGPIEFDAATGRLMNRTGWGLQDVYLLSGVDLVEVGPLAAGGTSTIDRAAARPRRGRQLPDALATAIGIAAVTATGEGETIVATTEVDPLSLGTEGRTLVIMRIDPRRQAP